MKASFCFSGCLESAQSRSVVSFSQPHSEIGWINKTSDSLLVASLSAELRILQAVEKIEIDKSIVPCRFGIRLQFASELQQLAWIFFSRDPGVNQCAGCSASLGGVGAQSC